MRCGALVAATVLLAACGKDRSAPVAPPPPPPSALRPTTEAPGVSPGAPKSVTISQVMLIYRFLDGRPGSRTREEAYVLAKSLIDRARGGERFETLLEYSDDRDEKGAVYNSGSYTLAQDSAALPAIKQAAFSTPVGQVAPEPVDAGTAFVVIHRDA